MLTTIDQLMTTLADRDEPVLVGYGRVLVARLRATTNSPRQITRSPTWGQLALISSR